MPNYKKYNNNTLLALACNTIDYDEQQKIKDILVSRFMNNEFMDESFIKIFSKFKTSKGVMKEIMADIIIAHLTKDGIYMELDNDICKDLVKNASFETLSYYGDLIPYIKLRDMCVKEVWKRAEKIQTEEKPTEENKYKRLIRKIIER